MAMDTGSNYSSYLNTGTWNHNIGYGPWTITAWIRSNDLRSTNQRYFFYGPSGPFIIFSADGNSPSSSPSVYSSGAFGSFGIKFQDGGKWQHFLVTRTSVAGGQFLCYIDGVRATTGVSAPAGAYNFPNDSYQIYGIFGNRVRDFGLFGCTAAPWQVQAIASGKNACSVLSNCKGYFPIRGSTSAALVRDVGPLRLASTAVGTLTPYADGIASEKSQARKRRVVGVVSVTVVDISGTVTVAFSPTGAIVGQGVISTSSAVAFAPSGTVVGLGVVSASSTVVFAPTASVVGLASVDSSSSLSFTATADLAGAVDASGTSSVTFASSAALTGEGVVTATSSLTFDATAAVVGYGVISSSSTLVFTASGTTQGDVLLVGSASVTFVPAAVLTGTGVVAGSSAVAFTPSGSISGLADLSSSVSLAFSASGSAYAVGVLSGSSTLTFTTHAHLDESTKWYASCVPDYLQLVTYVSVQSELPSVLETESVLLQRISFESELVLSLTFDSVMLEESTTQLRTGWYDG